MYVPNQISYQIKDSFCLSLNVSQKFYWKNFHQTLMICHSIIGIVVWMKFIWWDLGNLQRVITTSTKRDLVITGEWCRHTMQIKQLETVETESHFKYKPQNKNDQDRSLNCIWWYVINCFFYGQLFLVSFKVLGNNWIIYMIVNNSPSQIIRWTASW